MVPLEIWRYNKIVRVLLFFPAQARSRNATLSLGTEFAFFFNGGNYKRETEFFIYAAIILSF